MTSVEPQDASACPVHDFNPYELKPLGRWAEFYDQLREESPLVKNLFGRSYYVPTRHEDILSVLQDPQTFSSESVVAYEPDPAYRWIPHMINGDEHRQWRRQVGPYFSPRAVESIDAQVRAKARGLIGELAGRGSCDLMTDFALKFPTAIILEVVGLPAADLGYLLELEQGILHSVGDPKDAVRRKVSGIEAKETAIAGCPVAAGSMVAIVLKMSGRDDTFYDDAGTVDLGRGTSNHLAFGAGPHRCLGSHLARRELRVALEEWHRIIPDYRLGEGEAIVEFGRSSGVNTLPLARDV